LDPLYLLLLSGLVAALITWRLLIGSQRISRNERRASESLQSKAIGSTDMAALPRPRYRAMSLRICNSPCPAAIKLRNKSFLVDAVPQLPLPGCDRACFCEYATHDDRRVRDDRRYPSTDMVYIQGTTLMQDEGRKGQERRHRVEPYQGIY
jgi:hypothetical protein